MSGPGFSRLGVLPADHEHLGRMWELGVSWAAAVAAPPAVSKTNTARMDLAHLFIVDPPAPQMDLLGSSPGSERRSFQRISTVPRFGLSGISLLLLAAEPNYTASRQELGQIPYVPHISCLDHVQLRGEASLAAGQRCRVSEDSRPQQHRREWLVEKYPLDQQVPDCKDSRPS